jgi:hypothetical protein
VPALMFPIKDQDATQYPKNIIVPLAKDVLNQDVRPTGKGSVKPMNSNPSTPASSVAPAITASTTKATTTTTITNKNNKSR